MRNISEKVCRGNQNSSFMFNNVSRKSCPIGNNEEKYSRAIQATNDNVIRCERNACWITNATNAHSE